MCIALCLATPAKIEKFIDNSLVLADFGRSIKREVSVALMPDKDNLTIGDWILIHTGYAIQKLDPKEAEELLNTWQEVWKLEEKMKGKTG